METILCVERTHVITGNRVVVLSTAAVYFLSFVITHYFIRDITPKGVDQSSSDSASTIEMGYIIQTPPLTVTESEEQLQSDSLCDDENGKTNPIIERSQSIDTTTPTHTVSKQQRYSALPGHDDDIELAYTKSSGVVLSPASLNTPSSTIPLPSPSEAATAAVDTGNAFVKEIVFSKTFWRFCLLSLFLINLRAIFRHLDATLPTYLVRSFGTSYPKGIIYAINPFIIILLTPVIAGKGFSTHTCLLA